MENGLKNADPRDCTGYTGWAGEITLTDVLKLNYYYIFSETVHGKASLKSASLYGFA